MRRRRRIGRQQRAFVADAALPDRLSERRRSRHQHRHQIRHRRAGDENSARPVGKAEHRARPFDDLAFDLDRNVIAAAEIGVQSGRQHLRQHADGGAAAMHPSHEAGMNIAGRIGHDEIGELAIDLAEIGGLRAEARRETAREPHPVSAARPGARGCWRRSRSCHRACDDPARGSRPSSADRASRSVPTAAVASRSDRWSCRALPCLSARGARASRRTHRIPCASAAPCTERRRADPCRGRSRYCRPRISATIPSLVSAQSTVK